MFFSRFIDPTTDFGFKRLFGQEDSKEILMAFLNALLDRRYPITDLTYIPTEQLPASPEERISVYDVYCTDSTGARFIVEMQRNKAGFSMERALYYVTFPITQMGQKGRVVSPFPLLPIYSISILSFEMDEEPDYIRRIQLANTASGKVFYEKLTFMFIELPKFKLEVDQLTTPLEKWLYMLQTMPALDYIPEMFKEMPFEQAFLIAEQTKLTPQDRQIYELSLKRKLDEVMIAYNARQEGLEEGRAEGLEEGRAEGRAEGLEAGRAEGLEAGRAEGLEAGLEAGRAAVQRETARAMLAQGLDVALVRTVTKLSDAQIDALLKETQ